MGVNADCCRRPQIGKKDLKVYRGIKKNENYNYTLSNFEEQNVMDSNNENYLYSIYPNTNGVSSNQYQNFYNYDIGLQSNQIYSNQLTYPVIQTPDIITQKPFENSQYINSYNDFNQQNFISQSPYIENFQSTQIIQSQPEYQLENTFYESSLSNQYNELELAENNNYSTYHYDSSNPIEFDDNSSHYISSSSYEYNNYTPSQYISNNSFENNYISNNENNKIFENPVSYNNQNDLYQTNEYSTSFNYESLNNNYIETDIKEYFSNYDNHSLFSEETQFSNKHILSSEEFSYSQPSQYVDFPIIENRDINSKIDYGENQYSESYSQFQNAIPEEKYYSYQQPELNFNSNNEINSYFSQQLNNTEPIEIIQKTKYVCKPVRYIEKIQYIEPQTQIQQIMYSPDQKEFPDTQKEPEQINLSDRQPRSHLKELDDELLNINEDEKQIDGEFKNDDDDDVENIEKEYSNIPTNGKVIKSVNIEKNKENISCKVPGFISNFFSKIFNPV